MLVGRSGSRSRSRSGSGSRSRSGSWAWCRHLAGRTKCRWNLHGRTERTRRTILENRRNGRSRSGRLLPLGKCAYRCRRCRDRTLRIRRKRRQRRTLGSRGKWRRRSGRCHWLGDLERAGLESGLRRLETKALGWLRHLERRLGLASIRKPYRFAELRNSGTCRLVNHLEWRILPRGGSKRTLTRHRCCRNGLLSHGEWRILTLFRLVRKTFEYPAVRIHSFDL